MAAIIYPPSLFGGATNAPVTPDSVTVELGLGGSFRDLLVHEAYVQGLWPLSELIGATRRDVSGHAAHGTLGGSGIAPGYAFAIPEGVLGTYFYGTGYVEVPDDPLKNLSLAGGDMDVAFLMQTTQNDAAIRCIVAKQATSDTTGWRVALRNGEIDFTLIGVSNSVIFSFTRGSVADGVEHLIHCCYETTGVGARVLIDGVQSGAAVAVATEPVITTTPLRIGQFPDGTGSYIGALAMVMIGREGDPAMSPLLQAARTWTDVTADVRLSSEIHAHYGTDGTSPVDRMAGTGTMQFALNNAANNSAGLVGYYSLGHSNCRAGFDMRNPVRLTVTYAGIPSIKFRGAVATLTPMAGSLGSRDVQVTAVDWFNEAAEQSLGSLQTLTSVYSDDALRHVLDQADRPPPAIEFGRGDATFLYALDSAGSDAATILQELQRVTISEYGWLFQRGDGTLVFEGRSRRRGIGENAYTFTETMRGVAMAWDRDAIYNNIRVSVYPRQVDTTPSVLFAISAFQQINPGQIVTIDGAYRDPNQRAARVGGTGMVTPVATTDYLFNSASDGSGTDLTSLLTVASVKGGSATTFTLTNTGTLAGYLTRLQVRGQMVNTYEPLVSQSEDAASVRKYRRKAIAIDMPYQSWTKYANVVATQVLEVTSAPEPVAHTLTIGANRSPALMTQALLREPGDRIGVVETVTGLTTVIPASTDVRGHFISSVDLRIAQGRIVTATWGLTPADQIPTMGNSITYIGPVSGQQDLTDGPLILGTPGIYELTIQRGARLLVTAVAGGASGHQGRIDSSDGYGGAGGGGGAAQLAGLLVEVGVVPSWIVHVGAGGLQGIGTDGGETTFGSDGGTLLLQLQGGLAPTSIAATTGGLGGTALIGGGITGGAGGLGKSQVADGKGVNGGAAPANATAAAGGGGSGSPQDSGASNGAAGGAGGNGLAANGGAGGSGAAGGAGAAAGTASSGAGGLPSTATGSNNATGGGGGGGGVTLEASIPNRGGGGGGGGGGQAGVPGDGGAGSDGALVIALA